MVPIELAWFVVVLLFGLIGIVRGFLKELGVTTVLLAVLASIAIAGSKVTPLVTKAAMKAAPSHAAELEMLFWLGLIAVAAFISYHGQTLAFEGTPIKGSLGVFFNLGAGIVNGWLIAGSIWYYLDRLGYPFIHIRPEQLTATARALLQIMPPRLLGPVPLVFLVAFLLLMRVIR